MKIKLHICYIHAVGLSIALVCSLVGGSVSGNPKGHRSVDSDGLVESLFFLGSSIFSPTNAFVSVGSWAEPFRGQLC